VAVSKGGGGKKRKKKNASVLAKDINEWKCATGVILERIGEPKTREDRRATKKRGTRDREDKSRGTNGKLNVPKDVPKDDV